MDIDSEAITLRKQLYNIWRVSLFRPLLTVGIVGLSIFAALMEGIGLSFLIPIIETVQGNTERGEMNRIGDIFFDVFDLLGIPFNLEFVMVGVGIVMVVRYTSSFLVGWLKSALRVGYQRHLQTKAFDRALDARISYYDQNGSDEVLNAIVTQASQGAAVIQLLVQIVEQVTLSLVYLGIALYIAPEITILSSVLLLVLLVAMRLGIESGYAIGDRVAEANELLHESAQAGTQGIRDVKVFQLSEEIFQEFRNAINQYYRSAVKSSRNQAAMDNLYQLLTALTVFGILYVAVAILSLSVAELGVFLFSLFRLAPRVSSINNITYKTASQLPHLTRTHQFIDELDEYREVDDGDTLQPTEITSVAFEDVTFSYEDGQVLRNVSFELDGGEFVAFVGASGAGKSTIVSLLNRLYHPESGRITANGTDIEEFAFVDWREKVSMVRQNPFIFNETLRYNLTVGNRDATDEEIREVCELAQVTEFLDELSDGLDTILGDDGVRLSGGQRQRIAVARAILKDGDVLVLDEATSDLDTSLEQNIQENLEAAETERILVVIAHRLSTVVNADRIYTMENGQIVETGTHAELVDKSGMYAELYGSQ